MVCACMSTVWKPTTPSARPYGVQDAQFVGSYRGWGSRNMTGGIDEVKIWNRTLSRAEIREQRHLTLSQMQVESDPDLVAYYQFNEDTYFMVNKQGNSQHGVFTGPATLASSAAVVGSGVLDRVMVDGSGSYPLDAVGGSIEVPSGSEVPNGEVVVQRLDPAPSNAPELGLAHGILGHRLLWQRLFRCPSRLEHWSCSRHAGALDARHG